MRQSYIGEWEKWSKGFSYSIPVQVRFSETDMNGHLSNTVPAVYFEYARIEFFKDLGMGNDWLSKDSDVMTVVADLQIDFLKQVYFDEKLEIYLKIETVGRSSADIHYLVLDEQGDACLTGRGAVVKASKSTGKSMVWSDGERQKFTKRTLAGTNLS